ncbi:DNA polymerase ligase-domain-containing protein [Coniella lustricola]|uniref:DNA polymerase ligase-domain-containing protein n=1 Tax=Coniella lustricola TaxID=2025994 RepID=A0A2T3A9Z2_9PEZI|nr:DNA polymerase ligase-domain-containing protein [Coniella lustricola]
MNVETKNLSLELNTGPLNKRRNLQWRISPPPLRDPKRRRTARAQGAAAISPTSAQVESAQIRIDNHLAYFSQLLTNNTKTPYPPKHPRLTIPDYQSLYQQSEGSAHGAHFVVTQHDHPVAGTHYDLRLQINETSSCSWAIMYGLPGNPNSLGRSGISGGRAGAGILRNATETRVHCLWNHLIETGTRETGSLMVWDMGRYEVLEPRNNDETRRRRRTRRGQVSSSTEGDDDEGAEQIGGSATMEKETQQQKLARAFKSRKIRLKLHGVRLPPVYVVNLRLTQEEDAAARAKAANPNTAKLRRRRRAGQPGSVTRKVFDTDSSSGDDKERSSYREKNVQRTTVAVDDEAQKRADQEIRQTNAYTGANNSIGSVHQRKWFLSLDREACGFIKSLDSGRVWWQRKDDTENETLKEADEQNGRLKWPFYVRGPEHERSLVTGRLGDEILEDEGVTDFVRRKGWRPILS